ncbi:hypothetical protein B296_00022646 [Ensete ventricosum]|uniref:cysteine-S-conjugate beta-lyase n=1 Tax=Ensete ventricosum TaxID=4639 RepID=A0A427AM64_ENSVE|nr:hypothetical protein B296_00022646 [Ensete ventricosum]
MMSRRSDASLGGGDREKDTGTSAVAEGFADRLDDLSSESDIVMHSATKFISGHSDLMAGILAVKGDRIGRVLRMQVVQGIQRFTSLDFWSVKSLISLPCFMSHASIPSSVRAARGLTDDLVRISVGIEDVEDLIADLDYAIRSGPA